MIQSYNKHHHVMGRKVMDQRHVLAWAAVLAASMLGAGVFPYMVFGIVGR